ncbi:aspartyl-tRNA(Asn)/glutamyl-tRNA(Gln) amidotransferase subunit A [Kushneria sinocarnis]|uniref:Aspartyl-tRNA(Asn)/glutamyl-tRNA(Gln) amidotransferase subunit A n=1 Tax=Kushneria sinocarnis TaxID=595502 RepID=A0A420WZ66_9GAMM|nr:amidase [Kushneria sinocarnis]RKR06582.1 aspartyl-tRNA(Asn)/glutamyl-tRNA(Gln) amidotransferase subunit A [Kushneria sinocarnis]
MTELAQAHEFWQRPPRRRSLAELTAAWQRGDFSPGQATRALAERIRNHSARDTIFLDPDLERLEQAASAGFEPVGSGIEGVPVSLKDLFDVRGEITRAGSKVLADQPPAERDAPAVSRLRRAGALAFGRTNMTEFAFSGLGLNPHYGTPPNPFDGDRIPGGSTSGGAASVAFGLAAATLGSDTGGSLRVPAAFCGLTGFKPTQASVPREGAWPLSTSLDCIGPIAPTVECCARLWAALSGRECPVLDASPRPLRLALPQGALFEELDDAVRDAFEHACARLEAHGCRLERLPITAIEDTVAINARGGLVVPEAAALHHERLEAVPERFDPIVAERLGGGLTTSARDYLERLWPRTTLQQRFQRDLVGFDGVLLPATPLLPPARAPLERDRALFMETNRRALRHTNVFNYLDACALSLPFQSPQMPLPLGLMVACPGGEDQRVLQTSAVVEQLVTAEWPPR